MISTQLNAMGALKNRSTFFGIVFYEEKKEKNEALNIYKNGGFYSGDIHKIIKALTDIW